MAAGDLDHNKALVRRLIEIVNAGDSDAVAEVTTGELAEQARGWVGPFRAAFPDFRMDVVDVIAEGDRVVGHFRCSGTQQGEWQGRPPTGRGFSDVDEIYIFTVAGGKLAGTTAAVEDNLTRMRQLGLLDAAAAS